jgi:hypothetical protein
LSYNSELESSKLTTFGHLIPDKTDQKAKKQKKKLYLQLPEIIITYSHLHFVSFK